MKIENYSSPKLLLPYDRGGKGGVVEIALGGLAEQEVAQSAREVCLRAERAERELKMEN
ncbi:MAG: hypothetical protein J6K78_06875 [Tidjanibacter sp.]|nr:hypothetical protein [Tidjanibacter sp.]